MSASSSAPNFGSTPAGPSTLLLVIASRHVGIYPQPPPTIAGDQDVTDTMSTVPPPPSNNYTCLLSGPLHEFDLFARTERSTWLIDMAHDICDPREKRGTLFVDSDDSPGQWRAVQATDRLVASTYEYRLPPATVVSLSKISQREGKSKTSTGGCADKMRTDVMARDDTTCWISATKDKYNVNSHICPKRMGKHMARYIYGQFCGAGPAGLFAVCDAVFGLCLLRGHDAMFDDYALGFRHVAGERYKAHVFQPGPKINTVTYDGGSGAGYGVPLLHEYEVTPPRPGHPSNPPPGLFRWHYLQCVVKRFGHSDYTARDNIAHVELPMRMEGDSDDDGTDSEADWPSAAWDRGRLALEEQEEENQRQTRVMDWVSGGASYWKCTKSKGRPTGGSADCD